MRKILAVSLAVMVLAAFPLAFAQQIVNIGAGPNDHTGDPARTAFSKINANATASWAWAPTCTPPLTCSGTYASGVTFGINVLPGSGTVTNVSASVPSFLGVTVTNPSTTPNIAITAPSAAAGLVLATPAAVPGSPSLRPLVALDLPSTITSDTTGNAATATHATSADTATTATSANTATSATSAGTAAALSATPSQCTGVNLATGVAANGNANCRAIVAADLPATITSNTSGNAATATLATNATNATTAATTTGNAATATALATTPTQCTATQFATGIAANGNANCSTPGGGSAFNPAGGVILMADVRCTGNVTLSAVQACDGTAGFDGQIVFLLNQTTTTQNGLWTQHSGAWTRPAVWPSGGVIPAGSSIGVGLARGSTEAGTIWRLTTTSSVTIDTNAPAFVGGGYFPATTGNQGVVYASNSTANLKAAMVVTAPAGTNYCLSAADANGSVQGALDATNAFNGPCAIQENSTGHVIAYGKGTQPTVSAGSRDPKCSDNRCVISGLTAAGSVTITFSGAFNQPPACTAATSQNGVIPYITGWSTTLVTFTFSANLTGSLYVLCF